MLWNTERRISLFGLKTQLCCFPAVWTWKRHLTKFLSLSLSHTHTNSLSKHQHSYHNCVSLLTVYTCWSGKRMTWMRQEGGIFVKVTPFICFDTNMYVYEYVYAFPKLEKNQVLLFHWEQKYILETFQMYSCQIWLSFYFQTNIDVFC